MLKENDDAVIASQLPLATQVYIEDDEQTADETVLDLAVDDDTFVISGDKFVDYPEKSAVQEGRLIEPRIIRGQLIISPLEVSAKY